MKDAGIKKAGIFYCIFSQRLGINILGGPLWKSYQYFTFTFIQHSDKLCDVYLNFPVHSHIS